MKAYKYFTGVIMGLFLFVACQKEFSFENPFSNTFAKGSLKSLSGDCQPITLNGVFKQDSTLGDSNYVMVQVNFTSPGRYQIFTDLQNGFSFRDSAIITDTGLHTIKLKASGTPLLAQTTNFLVAFDTSYCTFSVPVVVAARATYSLQGSPNACSNVVAQGIYTQGTALNSSNTISVQVNVTAVGSYAISTGIVNGINFSGSGNFISTGLQNVTLQGNGTPTTAGINTIPISGGSSNCSFNLDVLPSGGGNPNISDSAWQFQVGSQIFNGPFFDVFDTTMTGIGYSLIFIGYTPATADTVLLKQVSFPSGSIQTGTYSTAAFGQQFVFTDYTDTADPVDLYSANATIANTNVQIIISAYDPNTGMISGSFSGPALNNSNQTVNITNGKFRAKVR